MGKSTLINTLFKSKISRKSVQPTSEERIPKTIEIKSITHGECRGGGAGGVNARSPELGMLKVWVRDALRDPCSPWSGGAPWRHLSFPPDTVGRGLPRITVAGPCWALLLEAVISPASPGESSLVTTHGHPV